MKVNSVISLYIKITVYLCISLSEIAGMPAKFIDTRTIQI